MDLKRKPIFFCCVGPAGSGKSTIIDRLINNQRVNVKKLVTTTTREPREGEVDGVNRHFITKEEFKKKIEDGSFFEYELVHDNYYGTSKTEIDSAIKNSYDLIFDIDIKGALTFKKTYPENAVLFFIVPPSKEELLNRVAKRSAVPQEEIDRRLLTAKNEYSSFLDNYNYFDYFLVNLDLDKAYLDVQSILYAERSKPERIDFNEAKRICSVD